MKLFFDENLSPRLASLFRQEYPGSSHVRNVDLVGASHSQIWNYCKRNEFTVVSKDTDFRDRSMTEGFPPKIIWLDVGNAGTNVIADLLQREYKRVDLFSTHPKASLLILSIYGDAV